MSLRKIFLKYLLVVSVFVFLFLGTTGNTGYFSFNAQLAHAQDSRGTTLATSDCYSLYPNDKTARTQCIADRGIDPVRSTPRGSGWFTSLIADGAVFMLQTFAGLAHKAAALLDISLYYTLNIAGSDVGKSLKEPVEKSWDTFRDFANLTFIFILLYIAIATILQLAGIQTRRVLIKLVIIALLVNFSLFITRAIVDVSNVIGGYFCEEIITGSGTCQSKDVVVGERTGMAAQIANQMNIASIYDSKDIELTERNVISVGIFGSIFLIIASLVFFSAAILFVVRTIGLLLFMILSPLAFAAMILPQTSHYATRWWHTLLGYAFMVPIYLVFMWFILQFMETVGGDLRLYNNDQNTFAAFLSDSGYDSVGIAFQFILLSGMLIAALVISRSIAGSVGRAGVRLGQVGAGMLVGGAGGWAARSLISKPANRWLNRVVGKDAAGEDITRRDELEKSGWTGRNIILKPLRGLEKSSFDARKPAQKIGGLASRIPGAEKAGIAADMFGDPSEKLAGGARALRDRKEKRLMEAAKQYESEAGRRAFADRIASRNAITRILTSKDKELREKVADQIRKPIEKKEKKVAAQKQREEEQKELWAKIRRGLTQRNKQLSEKAMQSDATGPDTKDIQSVREYLDELKTQHEIERAEKEELRKLYAKDDQKDAFKKAELDKAMNKVRAIERGIQDTESILKTHKQNLEKTADAKDDSGGQKAA